MFQRIWSVVGVLVVVATGCTKHNAVSCVENDVCTDPDLPFCDVDGAVSGHPHTCIAVDCVPSQFETCRGDAAVTCNATGDNFDLVQCQFGCNEAVGACNECTPATDTCVGMTLDHCGADGLPAQSETCPAACVESPTPHCGYVEPKYLPDACDQVAASGDLTVSSNTVFDTSADTACTGGIVAQVNGPDICIVRNKSISITNGASLRVFGARALALVADEQVAVDGVLDISGDVGKDGPGGGLTVSAGSESSSTGGGGGGFNTVGAPGGSLTANGGAANGGAAIDVAGSPVLLGGTRGGGVTKNAGGAAMLIACRGAVVVHGVVDAGGGGGAGGLNNIVTGVRLGGEGGGSGGDLLLQGLSITVTGQVFANGGGGGAGLPSNNLGGDPGDDGSRSIVSPAPGGLPQLDEGAGGSGALGSLSAGPGGKPTATGGLPGGGGGGSGILRTFTPTGVTPSLSSATAAPAFETNQTVPLR